jgi:hypothetical protein
MKASRIIAFRSRPQLRETHCQANHSRQRCCQHHQDHQLQAAHTAHMCKHTSSRGQSLLCWVRADWPCPQTATSLCSCCGCFKNTPSLLEQTDHQHPPTPPPHTHNLFFCTSSGPPKAHTSLPPYLPATCMPLLAGLHLLRSVCCCLPSVVIPPEDVFSVWLPVRAWAASASAMAVGSCTRNASTTGPVALLNAFHHVLCGVCDTIHSETQQMAVEVCIFKHNGTKRRTY